MPLITLNSNLVFTDSPPNYNGPVSAPQEKSNFQALVGSISPPFAVKYGINGKGNRYALGGQTNANNAIPLVDSMYDFGIASRGAQGGRGYPFPGSDSNGKYDWKPFPHSGFSPINRYQVAAGNDGFLKQTYLNNTPIDDVYNKYNLQKDSYNTSNTLQPYILRGIQRARNSDVQLWGFGTTGVIPRGGIVTYGERALVDGKRILSFLKSPNGLRFIGRQVALQLMNPNVENSLGIVRSPVRNPAGNTKIFTPVNLVANTVGSGLGLRFARHGLIGIPGAIEFGKYEKVVTFNRGDEDAQKTFNRLNKLYRILLRSRTVTKGGIIPTLSGITGPASVGGIGVTNIRRVVDSRVDNEGNVLVNKYTEGPVTLNSVAPVPFLPSIFNIGLTKDISYRDAINSSNSLPGHRSSTIKGETPDNRNGLLAERLGDGVVDSGNDYEGLVNTYTDGRRFGTDKRIAYRDKIGTTNSFPGHETSTKSGDEASNSLRPSPNDPMGGDSYGLLAKRLDDELTKNSDTYSPGSTPTRNWPGKPEYPNKAHVGVNGNSQKYATLSYGQIRKLAEKDTRDNNFINDELGAEFKGNPKYSILTGSLSDIRDVNNNGFTGDGIIKFKFREYKSKDWIHFRAYITNFNENLTGNWNSDKLQNLPYDRYLYASFSRSVNLSFKVTAESKDELKPMYAKLRDISRLAMPRLHADAPPVGLLSEVTIGDLFRNEIMIIDDISLSIDDDFPWDITDGTQVPMYIDVDLAMTYIGKSLPTADADNLYSILDTVT